MFEIVGYAQKDFKEQIRKLFPDVLDLILFILLPYSFRYKCTWHTSLPLSKRYFPFENFYPFIFPFKHVAKPTNIVVYTPADGSTQAPT